MNDTGTENHDSLLNQTKSFLSASGSSQGGQSIGEFLFRPVNRDIKNRFPSTLVITQKLQELAKNHPERVYFRQPVGDKWHEISYSQAFDTVLRMAFFLQSLDFEPGSRIAILAKNAPEWIMADMAIFMAGYVSVPIYPNQTGQAIRKIMDHSESKAIFVGKIDRPSEILQSLSPQMPHVFFLAEHSKYSLCEKKYYWSDVVKTSPTLVDIKHPEMQDLATIIYTSGTTGEPKGVMHTFVSLSVSAHVIATDLNFTHRDSFFSYLPLAHVAERLIVECLGLYSGGTISFAESLDTFANNLRDTQPTIFMGVPRIWAKFREQVLKKMPRKKLDILLSIPFVKTLIQKKIQTALGLSKARIAVSGAAPIGQDIVKWYSKLGIEILEGYGMTENMAFSHLALPKKSILGSVGKSFRSVECKIGSDGEILLKGPANLVGYYKNDAATGATFFEGYLKTGDLGYVDSEGNLFITGRIKDIFKTTKGKYITPEPIELQIAASPVVEQVCLCGSGFEQPFALVVLNELGLKKDTQEVKKELEFFLKTLNRKLDLHEKLSKIIALKDRWTPENGMLTPTLKIKRRQVENRYSDNFEPWLNSSESVCVVDNSISYSNP
jgi:long-chain acyl-CoA synthetase